MTNKKKKDNLPDVLATCNWTGNAKSYPDTDTINYYYPDPTAPIPYDPNAWISYVGPTTTTNIPLSCETCKKPIPYGEEFQIRLGKNDFIHNFCSKKCMIKYLKFITEVKKDTNVTNPKP